MTLLLPVLVSCRVGVVRVEILILFLILGESIESGSVKYIVNYRFFLGTVFQAEEMPLCSNFAENFFY